MVLAVQSVYGSVRVADLRPGFIDADRINRESVPAERATKKLEKEFSAREQELGASWSSRSRRCRDNFLKKMPDTSESDRGNKQQWNLSKSVA